MPMDEYTAPNANVPSNSWTEQKRDRCGNVTVGDLGNWHGGGFGLKLMQKMGYKLGEVFFSRHESMADHVRDHA